MNDQKISIQTADFDVGKELSLLTRGREGIGAVASFVGLVRADTVLDEAMTAMTLEHYPGMTEKTLAEIVAEAERRWVLQAVRVIHRVGKLLPGEQIVLVLVAAGHRGAAFAACEFIMDFLKNRAPFWKKEASEHHGQWVEAREDDEAALQRWQDQASRKRVE